MMKDYFTQLRAPGMMVSRNQIKKPALQDRN